MAVPKKSRNYSLIGVSILSVLLLLVVVFVSGMYANSGSQINDKSNQISSLNAQIGDIQTSLRGNMSEVNGLNNQVTNLTNQLTIADAQVATLTSQLTIANGQTAPLQNQISSLNSQISNLQTELNGNQSALSTANNQVTSLQTQLSIANSQITNLTSELSSANAQIANLQSQLPSFVNTTIELSTFGTPNGWLQGISIDGSNWITLGNTSNTALVTSFEWEVGSNHTLAAQPGNGWSFWYFTCISVSPTGGMIDYKTIWTPSFTYTVPNYNETIDLAYKIS